MANEFKRMQKLAGLITESQLNEETFYDKMKKANPGWSKEQTLSDFADEYEKQEDWGDIDVSGDYEDHQEYLKGAEMWFDKMASASPTVSIGDIVKVFAKSINKEVLGKIVGETMMQGNYGYAGNVEPNKIPAWKIDCYTEKNIGTSKKPIEYEGKKYYYIGTVQYPQYEEGTSFSKI